MRLKISQIVLTALLGVMIIIAVAIGIIYFTKSDILPEIIPGGEPSVAEQPAEKGVPGECLIFSEENCGKGSVLRYVDGRRASGAGFDLPLGEAGVYAPTDGYVYDFWWVDPENGENKIRSVVFADSADWSISAGEEKNGIHSFKFNASGWVTDTERKISINKGPVKKGDLIGVAIISEEKFFPGIFDKDHNMIMYPSAWWHDAETGYPSGAEDYIRYFSERFNPINE